MNLYMLLTFVVCCMFAVWFIFWYVEHPQLIPKCFQKKKRSYVWETVADYCQEIYGSHVDWDERFFICPDCCEPIYECDWEDPSDYLSDMCPICDYHWYDTEEENDERKAAGNEWYYTEEDEEMDEIDNEHDDDEEEE